MAKRSSLGRRVYLWLTTSERDRWNRSDYLSQRAMARAQRDRVQAVNDVFHRAGQAGRLHTYESLTLQFEGSAWSFLLLPAAFCVLLIVAITGYQSGERRGQKESQQRALEARAVASRAQADVAQRQLEATRAGMPATLQQLRVTEEEKRLSAQLEANMRALAEQTARAPAAAATEDTP